MKTVTVIQTRVGSSRLPGKVLMPLGKTTVLEAMLERVRASQLSNEVWVATTNEPADRAVVNACLRAEVPCYRGDTNDVLDRHFQVARMTQAEAIVKIPSDCPLIDPKIIDRVLGEFLAVPGAYDYASNLHPQSYPDGNDVEVMTFAALETAWREARRPIEREHTTPFIWDKPERFRLLNVAWETGLDFSKTHRWTLDYAEDYEVIRRLYEALSVETPLFSVESLVEYWDSHPEVARVNERHLGYLWYRAHAGELNTAAREGVI